MKSHWDYSLRDKQIRNCILPQMLLLKDLNVLYKENTDELVYTYVYHFVHQNNVFSSVQGTKYKNAVFQDLDKYKL